MLKPFQRLNSPPEAVETAKSVRARNTGLTSGVNEQSEELHDDGSAIEL